jgi:hypothetical protein
VEPQCDFTGDLERFNSFAVPNAVGRLVRGFIAANSQQMEHLAHLGVQAQALVDGAQQFGLGWLLEAQTDSGSDFLRQRLRQ